MPETDGIKDRKANRRELGDRSDSHVYRGMFMARPFQRARLSGIRGMPRLETPGRPSALRIQEGTRGIKGGGLGAQ